VSRLHVLSLLPEELRTELARHDVHLAPAEARRIVARAFDPPGSPPEKRPLSKAKQAAVAELLEQRRLEVIERVTDETDGFVKYLFRSPDGALTEAVRIPLEKPGRFTVCLSSQVGCAMQCAFCATGRLGLTRNLETWEMLSAFLTVRDEAPGRVSGTVFQGQGEPLQNYDNVIQAARLLSDPCAGRITGRNISISTVGLVPQIRRYAREQHPYRLVVSLTSAIAERRRQLLPVAGKARLEELAEAVREYAAVAREGRITLAWVLMAGVNSGAAEVREIQRLFGDLPLRINLIDVNDPRPDGFTRATDAERKQFMDELQVLRAPIVRRYSGGGSRHAACGMLASLELGARPQ
jgi:23S rRNA (adenine2503-C2)-methyltransferase